jgi:hypothetical protein
MLKMLKIKWLLPALLSMSGMLGSLALLAQQEVTVRVQVNRLPDGHYPTKIYQFTNTPGLVTLTLTNLTNTTRRVYLTGQLTGDNGVSVATAKNYQPVADIELAPLFTRTLNAAEASYLFDANNLVYLSGNTSIKGSVFGEQGLPEGTYQLCVRAIDMATRKPLSEEEPIGCSNIFQVTTLEPPVILNPYDEQALFFTPVQSIPIRWTTPPGAPPSTQYLLRIVELFGKRNPYDAIFSTPTPFFETTVTGAPLFFYTVQHPQLQEGRSYAMIVVAYDPTGNATFRNKGQSEVVQFTWGNKGGAGNDLPGQQPGNGPTLEYANHRLTGHVSGAFKRTETGDYSLFTGSVQMVNTPAAVAPAGGKATALATKTIDASPYLTATVSKPAFALQTTLTPLVSMNTVAAVIADATLTKPANQLISQTANTGPALQVSQPAGTFSASGASSSTTTYETITVDTSTDRFPLAGVHVTLRASLSSGNARNILLATGQSDKDGNYALEFLDPAYASATGVTGLTLSFETTDFENTSLSVPLSVLNSPAASIGNQVLLAKTMRVLIKTIFDATVSTDENGYGFHIYRDAQELQTRPWLASEGKTSAASKKPINVNGLQLIEVAADSIPPGSGNEGRFKLISKLDALGAGRIFLGGKLYVKIIPSSSTFRELISTVNALNVPLPANKILQARIEYKLTRQPSNISGTVYLPLGGEAGRIPVQGAIVRVMYKKADRTPGIDPNDLYKQTATLNDKATVLAAQPANNGVSQSANLNPRAAVTATATPAWTGYNVHDPGITTLEALAYSIADQGLYVPLTVEPKTTGGGLVAKAVLDPITAIIPGSEVPDDMKAITTTADELGNYYVMLPPLKKGAYITVEVINTPADFRKFQIEAQGYNGPVASRPLDLGASLKVDFIVKADVAEVVGRVVDDQGKPLNGARINYKGTTIGYAGDKGMFYFSIFPGSHTVTLEKEGYVTKDITVNVPQLTNGKNSDNGYASKWQSMTLKQKQDETLARVSQSPTVQASVAQGSIFSAAMFGIAAPGPASTPSSASATALFNGGLATAFGISTSSPGSQYEVPRQFALDLKDVGYLNKIVGKARFRVVEEGSSNPIAGVHITVFDSTNTTDAKGEWYYEGFGGSATLTLIPPAGTHYIAEQKLITLVETGKEQVILISLKTGVLISGTVTSNGKPLPNARILLDGQDFAGLTTDANGHYEIYTTSGEHSVGARKQGFVGKDQPPQPISGPKVMNFDLPGPGNNRNYATLLGFDIELDDAKPAGAGQETWSGNFVRLQSVDKNVFSVADATRIPFSNLTVSFDISGKAVPLNDMVKTDLTELPLKLFGYLPVKLTGDGVVTFTSAANGKGELNGKISIAFNLIQGYRGWNMGESINVALATMGAATPGKITLFNSGGAQAAAQSFALMGEGGAAFRGTLYNFRVELKGGKVDKEGMEFSGSIATPTMGPIKSMAVDIKTLTINKGLTVSGVILQTDNLPSLEIATWKMGIDNLIFNEEGFKIGGGLNLALPKSASSLISFSDLVIAYNGVFGGKFAIPDRGIDVLALSNLLGAGAPVTFGRVGNSDVYRLAGKGNYKINVPIFSDALPVPSFEIMTNGDFSVQIPVGRKTNLGKFSFNIAGVLINSKDNTPSITVQGKFMADFNFLAFDVSDITVRGSSSGPVFSIAKVGVKLNVPVMSVTVMCGFTEFGFEGEGQLGIAASPIGGMVGFKYFNRPAGIELGAKFFANIPPIPIGVVVTLEGVGGGFSYDAGRPGNGGFEVDVNCKLGMLGTGAAVALNPLGLKVISAGVFEGYGDIQMASYFKKGHAAVKYNGPERVFTVQVDIPLSPMESMAEERIKALVVISAKEGDEYAFFGCESHFNLIGLIDNRGAIAVGIRLKNPKTRGDIVSEFFNDAPEDYMRERFSGVYINVAAHVGRDKDHALGLDFGVGSVTAWFYYQYDAQLLLNFEENAYRLKFGGGFGLGVEACAVGICVGASAQMCIHVEGGRNNTVGWNFVAKAAGSAEIHIGGDCGGCNEIYADVDILDLDVCIGAKLCGTAWVELKFTEANGVGFNAGVGGNVTPCN